jgi:hypothetical protein
MRSGRFPEDVDPAQLIAREDRALTVSDGFFVDDFRGRNLYQRFGGGPMRGYGDAPLALHLNEIG